MAHVITFNSESFDVTTETPNKFNPIAGESLLKWLRARLIGHNCEPTSPAPEDWGWYIDVRAFGGSYLVGASADAGEPGERVDWTVQIHKHRSLMEKILGKNKLDTDDPLSDLVQRLLRDEARVSDLSTDRET